MKDLQMLVQLLSGVKVSKMNIIGTEGESGTKVQQLYDAILEGEITDDTEGAQRFFPDGANSLKYFSKLKRSLKNRLLNTLFFIDVDKPQFTEYQKASQVCNRNLAIVKLLYSYGQRNLGVAIAHKTFKKAVYFDFTEIALMLSKELRVYYSTITGEKEKARLFSEYVDKYLKIYTAELEADKFYSDLMVNYIFSKANKPELKCIAVKYCDRIDELSQEVDSYRFRFMYYLIFILRYEIENDYRSTLILCEQALEYFLNQKHIGVKNVLFNLYLKMIACNIQLQQFEEAKRNVSMCLDLAQEGGYNWYITQELHFLLMLRSYNYQNAYKIYINVFGQPNFNAQQKAILERWKINEAFVHFLTLKGKIVVERGTLKNNFRINKFLNEVPKLSQDKRGTNITLLVLQVLFLLEKERYEDIFERIEPLRMYSSRHLRKDDTFRGNCFIKMLMQLPAGRFHKEAVKRKAAPYLKKLHSVPLDVAKQTAELEIIPYEELWEYVMESLENKVR
jgi:hypothetical protein